MIEKTKWKNNNLPIKKKKKLERYNKDKEKGNGHSIRK